MSAATGARVALRVRTGLEAADLGFAMARAWWRPLASTWLAFVAPLGALLVWGLREWPAGSLLLLWWLRPLFASVPLHVLSLELFGTRATLAGTARALPGLLASSLAALLPHRRLSPSRTYLQPVRQLEGLRGAARRARVATLARRDTGAAAAAMLVVAHLHGAFLWGLVFALALATPREVSGSVASIVLGNAAVPTVLPALYLLGISLFEPLAVACGFALYLNRRVYLEGWEIELAFRRLAERWGARERARRLATASAAALALALALAPPVRAAPEPAAAPTRCIPGDPASAPDCIHEVLSAADFGTHEKKMRWVPRTFGSEPKQDGDLSWLRSLASFVARFAQVLLYGGLGLGLAALALALLRGARGGPREEAAPLPRTFLGLDLDPASLPDDAVAAARALWLARDRTGALSLLYRAALVKLATRGALEIPDSATELECVRAVGRTQAQAVATAFGALTGCWVRARYAHEPPSDGEFDALCASFGAFEGAP